MIAAAAICAAIASEGLAAYVLAEWLAAAYAPGTGGAVQGVFFVLVALIGFLHLRVAEWLALSRRATLAFAGVTAFVVLYGILRIEFAGDFAIWNFGWARDFLADSDRASQSAGHPLIAAMLLVPLWARSAWRSGDEVDLEAVPRALSIPFVGVTVILVVSVASGRTGEIGRAGAAFYTVAVLALAFSQSALSGATIGEVRAGGVTAALLGGITGATLVGVALFALVFGVLGPILGPPLGATVEQVLTWVLTPPAWLLEQFFRLLFHGRDPLPNLTNMTRTGAENAKKGPAGQQGGAARAGAFAMRTLALLIVAAAIGAAVAISIRLRRRARTRLEGMAASVAGSAGEDLRSLWRSVFRRGGDSRTTAASQSGTVRLYRQVLDHAAERGRPKNPAETPREFAPVLSSTFHAGVTDEITAAFHEARYAGREPDPRTLAELERRWREARAR